MEDLTGLGKAVEGIAKLAESQVVIRSYEDLLSDATKEGGKVLVDAVKTFRLFTAPVQLLAVAQDRLAMFCERVRSRVPTEQQVEALPSIATPVLLSLRYMEDDKLLTELFLNLLSRSIDKERQDEAHPAFVRIIEQMSPDEALVMYVLRDQDVLVKKIARTHDFPTARLAHPEHFFTYVRHLESLALVENPMKMLTVKKAIEEPIPVRVTEFGRLFTKACIPDNIEESTSLK